MTAGPRAAKARSTRPGSPGRQRVLFLCVHNSARSQMAEGMLHAWASDRYEAHSAGNVATRLRPEAVAVMDELGIDIRAQRSKDVAEYAGQRFDWAITTCDDDQEACPFFPGAARREYWPFDDPSAASGSPEERMDAFRRIRDEIAARIQGFLGTSATG